ADVNGSLDRPLPVADRGDALVLVRARPAIERQDRGELQPRLLERGPELSDLCPFRPRVRKERDEIRPRRELDRVVADVGSDPADLAEGSVAEHVWVERDLHVRTAPLWSS